MVEHLDTPARGSRRHNLPAQLTSFIGREAELDAASRLLVGVRLLTLTGPGGTGKTRLALRLADRMLDQYPDGACFVELASIASAGLVLNVALEALGLPDTRDRPPIEILKDVLRARHLLLLFDNFEHVLEAGPRLTELLAACPGLTILVTSRIPLRVSGEQELPLAPLTLPVRDRRSASGADLLPAVQDSEAARLFVARARAVAPAFALTEANAAAVAELCWRLDGLPLAIELAAARVRLLSPERMLERLGGRPGGGPEAPVAASSTIAPISPLRFLTAGARDVPTRHQTLRNTIAWSYDLLPPSEQTLFRRLAVFVGGCTLESAEAVATAEVGDRRWAIVPDEVLDGVESLISKSLLRSVQAPSVEADASATAEPRLLMLETVREYGLEQLEQQGELLALRRWHVQHMLALVRRAEPGMRGPEQPDWLDRLEAEHDNLRAALEWALNDPLDVDSPLWLTGGLAWFWLSRGHLGEGRRWLARAMDRPDGSPAARLKALNGLGWLAHHQRDLATTEACADEALALARALGDRWAEAWTLHVLGRGFYYAGQAERARALGEQSLAIAQAVGDDWLTGWVLQLLGLAAHIAGDYATARRHNEASLALRRRLNSLEGIAITISLLCHLAHLEGDDHLALQLARECIGVARRVFKISVQNSMAMFAGLAASLGQPERAARLAGASSRGDLFSLTRVPLTVMGQAMYDEGLEIAHRELDEATFARAWSEGQALTLDEAIAEAMAVESRPAGAPAAEAPAHVVPAVGDVPDDPSRPSSRRSSIDLTAREAEVLRLIVAGKTTREIALSLAVSTTTVERHITHLYGKIGARGRAEATVFALEHGITPGA